MSRFRSILGPMRLFSGLVLLFYVTTHLLNHSMGLLGLATLEGAQALFVRFWRSPLMYWVVPLSALVHVALALARLLGRRTFRGVRRAEWAQLALGLLIPLLLTPHIYFTRIASRAFGLNDTYSFYIAASGPDLVFMYVTVVVVWVHGNIGLRAYLRQKPWYERLRRPLEALGLLLPVLAIAGIISASREVQLLSRDPAWLQEVMLRARVPDLPLDAMSDAFTNAFSLGYLGLLGALFAARAIVLRIASRQHAIQVGYADGTSVTIARGTTLLEASLQHNIPHAHVCGGRGRCSTCRVQIVEGLRALTPPSEAEVRVLKRISASADIRLACQTTPRDSCVIQPLLPQSASPVDGFALRTVQQGSDREIAILFADLRGFTSISEHKLPYDTVFILNQYFQAMGQAIEAAEGYLDKFIGDGIMALFGVERGIAQGCRDALLAARIMAHQLDTLNRQLRHALSEPLQLGMGLHCGHVIVGEMGYSHAKQLTAIGDAVNSAARLEGAAKDHACQLVVSAEVVERAAVDFAAFARAEIDIRGRTQRLAAYLVPDAKAYALPGA